MTRKTPVARGNLRPYRLAMPASTAASWNRWMQPASSGAQCHHALMTASYWGGRRIVEAEQKATTGWLRRAADGEVVRRSDGAIRARVQPGQPGEQWRFFAYLRYSRHCLEICELPIGIRDGVSELTRRTGPGLHLPWSAYVRLLSVMTTMLASSTRPRRCTAAGARQLDRQIGSQFYERTALSRTRRDAPLGSVAKPEDAVTPVMRSKTVCAGVPDLKDEYSNPTRGLDPGWKTPAGTRRKLHLRRA